MKTILKTNDNYAKVNDNESMNTNDNTFESQMSSIKKLFFTKFDSTLN